MRGMRHPCEDFKKNLLLVSKTEFSVKVEGDFFDLAESEKKE